MQYFSYWSSRFYLWCRLWDVFKSIWRAKVRRHELTRLVRWAERKRFSGPRKLYERRLAEEEQRLFRHQCRHPRLVTLVSILHTFFTQIKGEPRYYKKGSAAKYRYR